MKKNQILNEKKRNNKMIPLEEITQFGKNFIEK